MCDIESIKNTRSVFLLIPLFACAYPCYPCSSVAQFRNVRSHRLAERLQIVSTLETGNETSFTTTRRPLFHRARHLDEVFVLKQQLSERIPEMRVETRRDDDQIGTETRRHLLERGFERALLLRRRRRRTQRQV